MKYSENPDKQYHIQVGGGRVGRYVILPGDPKRCAKIAAILMTRSWWRQPGVCNLHRLSGRCKGQCNFYRYRGPSASIAMEELVKCGAIRLSA